MKLFRLCIAISVLSFFGGCGGAPGEETGSNNSETRVSSSSSSSKLSSSVKSSSRSSEKSSAESSSISSTSSYQRASRPASSVSISSASSSLSSDSPVVVFKPTTPGKPEASVVGPRTILITWQPSESPAGITAYLIYRNGFNIATVDGFITQYENIFLLPEETYTYYVMARDANNTLSLKGEPNTFTTPKEVTSSKSSVAASSMMNISSSSSESSISSSASSAIDVTAPTKPTNLQNQNTTETSLSIKWTDSTDAVGVVNYEVLRDGVKIATLPSTTLSYNDTGLTAGTIYKYKVSAFDAAGNFSTSDEELVTSTKAMPTTMTLNWNHPTARENGEVLSIEEIGGYEIRYKLPTDTLFTYIQIPGNATTMYIAPRATMDTALIEIATYDINGLYSRFVELKPDI